MRIEPRDESTRGGEESNDVITTSEVESIANPLTVVHGYTELLQRRIRRGRTIDNEELLRVLGLMEEATRSLRAGVVALVAKLRSRDGDSGPA